METMMARYLFIKGEQYKVTYKLFGDKTPVQKLKIEKVNWMKEENYEKNRN